MSEESYTILRPFRHGKAHQFLCLKADQWTARSIELYGEYSESEVDVFRRFIKPDSVCIDAGALFGAHTVAMAELARFVWAFEPQRIAAQMIAANCQLNSMDNVEVYQAALGDKNCSGCAPRLDVRDQGAHWGMSQILPLTDDEGLDVAVAMRHELISVVCLNRRFAYDLGFIKIDCEGSEPAILTGGMDLLRTAQPVVYIEANTNRDDIKDLLKSAGYRDFWWHYAVCDREPNYLGRLVPPAIESPVMLLALPRTMVSEHLEWIESNGFRRV